MSKKKVPNSYVEIGEFKSIVLKQACILSREITFRCQYPDNYKELVSYSYPDNFSWSQRLYHYINDDMKFDLGKCPVCDKRCRFYSITKGYSKYCSLNCYGKDCDNWKIKETLSMTKDEILNLLGEHPNGYIEEYRFKKIFPEHYTEIMKWEFPIDFKWTQKIYHYLHNDNELKMGVCPVCGKRCGFHRFGDGYKNHCSLKCKSLDPDVQDRTKNTCMSRYGKEYYAQTTESKNRNKQICLNKFGYTSYAHTPEFIKTHRKRIEYGGVYFDSSWEIYVYKYCLNNDISFEYQPCIMFDYEYDGVIRKYYPDFLINGKLYEVKGNHFFKDGKMINPYNRSEDELYEAKHQCMIDNNVVILTKYEINHLDEFIKKEVIN